MSADPVKIGLYDVHKSFGTKRVLRGVDLEVSAGESLVIIGGSGTGKSVTIKSILGFLTPDSGRIEVDGADAINASAAERDAINQNIGMLFQHAALFDSLNVWENVAFGLMQGKGLSRKDAHEIAIEKLSLVGLDADIATRTPGELSGGMRKRVGLARAIALEPDILFFDEPTTGIDPIMADVINDLIVECVKEVGATALTITHDMKSAQKIGDRIAMLYEGKIIWVGPAQEIDEADNPVVDQFIHGRTDGPIPSLA